MKTLRRWGFPAKAWAAGPAWALLTLTLPAVASGQETYALEDLLRIGQEQNPSVEALRASRAALEADRRAGGRWENPEMEWEVGTGDPFESTERKDVGGISLRQVLENPISRHYRLRSMELEAAAAGEEVRLGILEVEFEIRMHYYRILFLTELLGLARENEEALASIRGLMETRAALGEVRELEAIRLRVEHLKARNEAEAVALELGQYRRHLNTYLGNVLPDSFRVSGQLSADGEEPELETLVRDVLPHHPALLKAARNREAAEAGIKVAGMGWIPDPEFTGSSRKELDGDIKTFGIGFRVPLWNFSRSAAEREKQHARALQETERALFQEMEAQLLIHLNRLRLGRQTLALFEEGLLEEARASMDIAEVSYREGEVSFVEYLDARRTYRSIQIEYQQALYDWNFERAALERAAGGGVW